MAEISKITLPTGTTYDIKDATARSLIDEMSGYTDFLGVTTTTLTDGATTNPITVSGSSVTAVKGNIATYGSAEFIFNGTAWQAFGDLSGLGELAYQDSVSASYKPAGSVSQPTFTGTEGTVSVSGTIANSVTLSSGTSSGTGKADVTPAGTVSKPTFTGSSLTSTGTFTPAGTVSPTVTVNTTTVNSITAVGTLPSCTLPVFSTSVSGETLTLGWSAGSFSKGTLPTKGSNTTVATGIKSATATFTGTEDDVSVTGTPAGTVSQPTFTGTAKYVTASVGTASKSMTGTFTPAGTVSKPSFTGTQATITSE